MYGVIEPLDTKNQTGFVRSGRPPFRWPLAFIVLLMTAAPCEAWIGALARLASEAGSGAAKVGVTAARVAEDFIKARPVGSAGVLERVGKDIRAVDAKGRSVVLGSASAGAVLLTPDGLQLLRQIDVFVNEADLPQLKEALTEALRLSGRDAHLVKADGTVAKLRVDPARAGAKLLAEERAGLFVEMGEAWLDDLRWVLDLPLDRSRMHVMTFLDTSDADVARLFDDAAGALHVNAPLTSAEEVIAVLKTFERETVFVVGHVEDGSLVIRNPAGEIVVAVRIDELEAAARAADTSLIVLGCETAGATSVGFLNVVEATQVAKGLAAAIAQPSMGHALSTLSRTSGDLMLQPQFVDAQKVVFAARSVVSRVETGVEKVAGRAVTSVRIGTVGRERGEELAARIIPGVPSWLQMTYVFGLILLVFMGRRILRNWRAARMPAPRFRRYPLARIGVELTRRIGFLLLVPFGAFASASVLLSSYVMTLGAIVHLEWTVLIALFFGWKWWRQHSYRVDEESLLRRFLSIPFFVFGVVMILMLPLELVRERLGDAVSDAAWTVLLAIPTTIVSYVLWRLLSKTQWQPLKLIDWLVALPLRGIESVAGRIISPTRAH